MKKVIELKKQALKKGQISKPGVYSSENLDVSLSEPQGQPHVGEEKPAPSSGNQGEPGHPAGHPIGHAEEFHCWAAFKHVIPCRQWLGPKTEEQEKNKHIY